VIPLDNHPNEHQRRAPLAGRIETQPSWPAAGRLAASAIAAVAPRHLRGHHLATRSVCLLGWGERREGKLPRGDLYV